MEEFTIINENNEFKKGKVISVFNISNSNREIVLFSSEDFDSENANLQIAYLNIDEDGYNYISQIDDEKVLKEAMYIVKDMIEVINNG